MYSSLRYNPAFDGLRAIAASWHYPVAVYFRDWLPWYLTISIVAAFAVTVATASYVTIERPLQRYRRALGARLDNQGAAVAADSDWRGSALRKALLTSWAQSDTLWSLRQTTSHP